MVNLRKKARRLNRYESVARKKALVEHHQKGEGIYVFRNNNKGTLDLPKPTKTGQTRIPENGEWEGDSYFMILVKNNMARLIRVILSPEEERKQKTMNEQLILDQPPRTTSDGVVEQILVKPENPVNSNKSKKKEKLTEAPENSEDLLITEDPLEGVVILG